MHKILADTCVWLDMAKDSEQQSLLTVIEELVKRKELALIVPRLVTEEFARNKDRIIKESSQSISSIFKRVKDLVEKFADPKGKDTLIEQLNNIDYKIPSLGETAIVSVARIENLLNSALIIEATDEIKLRSAQRALDKRAPFHRDKNSFNDAIIMETYASCVQDENSNAVKFSFVTHNKRDFSLPNGNDKIPHPDFANCFFKNNSQYYIKLSEAIHSISPELVTGLMVEKELLEEPRSLSEILQAEIEFSDRIWYDRKLVLQDQMKAGLEQELPSDIKKAIQVAMKHAEAKYGGKTAMREYYKNDFEWGMLNGKLSAIRWVLGDEWDNLDT